MSAPSVREDAHRRRSTARPTRACASWIRWTLWRARRSRRPHRTTSRTRRRRSPANPIVYMPRARASRNPAMRSREPPLVDMATAMSPGPARAMSWRANTRSKPTSLPSAVRTAWSAASDHAGRGSPTRRPREQRDEGGDVGGAAAVAEREHPPARGEPARHLGGGRRDQLPVGVQVDSRSAALSAALAAAEAARSRSSASWSRSSASRKGYRKSVAHGSSPVEPIAVPACTSSEVAGPHRADEQSSRRPRRLPPCAPGRARRTSPSRPSSEQVTQTSSVHSASARAGRGARSRRG